LLQEVHWVCPGVCVIWPAGHGVHGATEVLEKVPAAQPVTQLVSALEPGAEDNPEGHLLQLDEFAGDQ
jgi:hypothetical protein